MPDLDDIAHFCSWNGYAKDMRTYLPVNRSTWTCEELWFPHGVNMLYGPKKKSRIQRICENMAQYSWINYIDALLETYHPLIRVKELIALGGNPDIKDISGWTPLLICAKNGWANHITMINILLDAGVDINGKGIYGFSALRLAASNNHISIVRELLTRGANIHLLDDHGYSPCHAAAAKGHLEVLKILLAHGAILTESVMRAAIQVSGNVRMIKYLHANGCPMSQSPMFYALTGKNYHCLKTLSKLGADPNEMLQESRMSVLETYIDTEAAVLALCQVGADVNIVSNFDPLICEVVKKGGRNLNVLKTLCKYKVNLNTQDINGQTPLHIVTIQAVPGNKEDITFLKEILKHTNDFTMLDNAGETALDIAKSDGSIEIVYEINRAMLRRKN